LSTGFFVLFLNSAPLIWFSKLQRTVETAAFGAQFVAMKNGMETVTGLRCMLGIPICGPAHVRGDNVLVIHNVQRPKSTLKKKSNSVCHHRCRDSVAMKECMPAHVPTKQNLANLRAEVILGGAQQDCLVTQTSHG
jgi:hypothetical protein